jgi:hypothetical protein
MGKESRGASERPSSLVRVSRRWLGLAGEVGPQAQVPPEGGRIPARFAPDTRCSDGSVPTGASSAVVQQHQPAGACRAQQERALGALPVAQAAASDAPQSIPAIATRTTHGSRRQRTWLYIAWLKTTSTSNTPYPKYTATLGTRIEEFFSRRNGVGPLHNTLRPYPSIGSSHPFDTPGELVQDLSAFVIVCNVGRLHTSVDWHRFSAPQVERPRILDRFRSALTTNRVSVCHGLLILGSGSSMLVRCRYA